MTLRAASTAYRALFVAFIIWASVRTVLDASRLGAQQGVSLHFLHVLAGCEVLAAAAFLWRRVEVFAAAGLLLVFAVASLHVLRNGQAPVHLVFYAATVCWLLYLRRAEHAAIRRHDVRAP